MTRALIVNLGMGNIFSLESALTFLGVNYRETSNASDLHDGSHLILPGVGAYDAAMQKLDDLSMIEPIRECVHVRRMPILGICLGMQIICSRSEEGMKPGLGLIEGEFRRLLPNREYGHKVPHVGFSKVTGYQPHGLFKDMGESAYFYFTHSFALPMLRGAHINVALCDHSEPFVAGFQCGLISGVQFHPEKSQSSGLRLLRNFLVDK